MKIMASWTTLSEIEGAKTRRNLIYSSGKKEMKQFTNHRHLRFISDIDIKWTPTIIGVMRQFY